MGRVVSIILSAAYFVTIPWHPFPGSWIVKAASIAILALLAFRGRAFGLALALACSAVGDALLEYSPRLFTAGLVAFLIAQVTYTATFVRCWRGARPGMPAIAIGLYSLTLAAWLVPGAGPLGVPVAIYVAAIAAMAVSAFTAGFSNRWVEMGAVLFLISDSVLAITKFRTPLPLSGWIVWSTYYAAQLLITRGYLKAEPDSKPLYRHVSMAVNAR